jgi:hypothetical protein
MNPTKRLTVYDPTAEPQARGIALAPRLATLRGRRAGILDNGKPNADVLMSAIVERLRASHGVAAVVKRGKPVAGPPSDEALADLSRCDFALVGSAD